eukprot:NODE_1237_length_1017_cov_289.457645_g951_i0.p1 GENE.NODE_1237_length_1017_cov_289.457645_g951_i0~~NODE_1237_length_1017_cov_289.457645_g951_i0.p1  ORF type:complete len:202 (-),score=49.53 NODE_1237_length_1017_cov_289.457645_g951_i0:89-694(-)
MGKGTSSFGKCHTKAHALCKRCGKRSYHIGHKRCAACWWPQAKKKRFNWSEKSKKRKAIGTGRLRHMKHVLGKAKFEAKIVLRRGPHRPTTNRFNREKKKQSRLAKEENAKKKAEGKDGDEKSKKKSGAKKQLRRIHQDQPKPKKAKKAAPKPKAKTAAKPKPKAAGKPKAKKADPKAAPKAAAKKADPKASKPKPKAAAK